MILSKLRYIKKIPRISFTICDIDTFVITLFLIKSSDINQLDLEKKIVKEVICENINVPFEIREEEYRSLDDLIA